MCFQHKRKNAPASAPSRNSQKAILTAINSAIKKATQGGFFNGGLDAHRFELLVQRYVNNLDTKDTDKICYLINKLLKVA